MTRKKLTIRQAPKREPELIRAEIKQLEEKRRASMAKRGLADRVAAIDLRLAECRAELAASNG